MTLDEKGITGNQRNILIVIGCTLKSYHYRTSKQKWMLKNESESLKV